MFLTNHFAAGDKIFSFFLDVAALAPKGHTCHLLAAVAVTFWFQSTVYAFMCDTRLAACLALAHAELYLAHIIIHIK